MGVIKGDTRSLDFGSSDEAACAFVSQETCLARAFLFSGRGLSQQLGQEICFQKRGTFWGIPMIRITQFLGLCLRTFFEKTTKSRFATPPLAKQAACRSPHRSCHRSPKRFLDA